MKKLLYLFIISSFVLISCKKDFLDTIPKGLVIAQTTSDFRKLLDNADTRYTNNLAQVSGYVDAVSNDSQLDSSWYDWERNLLHVKKLYAFEPEVWTPDGDAGDAVWKQNYYVSTLVSNVLDEIGIATDNPKLQKQLIAEAKVHRAYAYLTLVNIYAKHYNKATAASDLGVPLIGNPAKLPSLERASVQTVYNFILSELLGSIADLPNDIDKQYSHRPTKASAYAILARTYLYMGNYEKSFEYANKSLEIRNFLYNYNTIYTGSAMAVNLKGISRITDDEMLMHKTATKNVSLDTYMKLDTLTFNSLYSGYARVNDSVINNFDLRRTLWFTGFNSNGTLIRDRATYVYNNYRYSVDAAIVDYIPISTPEMYLVRAESNARNGHLQEALNDVNKIRTNRFKTGTYTPLTVGSMTQAAVINEVLLERRRELYGKELRLFDDKRLGLPVAHVVPGTLVKSWTVPANDPKLIFPIYYEYIVLNPEMVQNPR